MILEENRTASYIRSLYTGNTELLDTIEQEALRDYVPIIRVETQSLLKLLLKQKKPRRILELGTAVGFSALLMCEYAPSDCHVTTIENYEKRILLQSIILKELVNVIRSHCWREMPWRSSRLLMVLMILSLWMQQRRSISTIFRN